MKFKVVIHAAEEGGYWANVPALPGCVSEGDTMDEMLANIREAIECYLDEPDQRSPVAANAPTPSLPERAFIKDVEVKKPSPAKRCAESWSATAGRSSGFAAVTTVTKSLDIRLSSSLSTVTRR